MNARPLHRLTTKELWDRRHDHERAVDQIDAELNPTPDDTPSLDTSFYDGERV